RGAAALRRRGGCHRARGQGGCRPDPLPRLREKRSFGGFSGSRGDKRPRGQPQHRAGLRSTGHPVQRGGLRGGIHLFLPRCMRGRGTDRRRGVARRGAWQSRVGGKAHPRGIGGNATIKVGSRDSRLAVVQAEEVCRALGDCELITMKTLGDMILDKTLDQVGGKGLFVKELDRALADRRVDLTVHSLKDVPMEQPEGLPLVAYTRREDARDALVLPQGGAWDKSKPIGCSSARRRVQLAALFPDLEVKPVRGNVLTRLDKLDRGEYGALVL